MGRAIRIIAGDVAATAELNETRTATAIWDALPIEARGQTWGDEIYFASESGPKRRRRRTWGHRARRSASSSVPLR